MIIYRVLGRRLKTDSLENLRPFWFIALLATALMVAIIALGASIRSTAMAAPTQADDPSSWAKTADGGGAQEVPIASNFPKAGGTSPFFQANSPSEETESAFSDSEAGFEAVWQANLTVGYATDSITTLLGYMPEVYGSDGALDLDSFSYDDQSFVIENLVFQQVLGGAMQLVLNANQRLPDDLVFQAKTQEYPIQESMALGLYNNIHIWRVDTPLDWTEGETFQVILWRVLDTGAQQSPQFVGPAPLHTLPDGTHVDGTIEAGESLAGEITVSGQFKYYKLILEPGRKYRIDMLGADTGDGSLSDPWISGINGPFQTALGPRLQPTWYDEQGRRSTTISLPTIGNFELDQYGRMYVVRDGAGGESVLRAVMGANDDGGEGFNARLYLVNFPGTEYRIAVSGSPNPSPVGTFTVSLTDVSEDDYSADASNAGELTVGGYSEGDLEAPADVDWFAAELTADTSYQIEIRGKATSDGSLGQPRLAGIYDSEGNAVSGTGNTGSAYSSDRNTSVEFTPDSNGVHYVAATSFSPYMPNRSRIPAGTYRVSVSVLAD